MSEEEIFTCEACGIELDDDTLWFDVEGVPLCLEDYEAC